ncbi:MAG: beta-N-acetylhexosaminidase [Eubacteriales bacterium]|nr:beta-N-acetylhexosaminidase [Eubacteriales bacterium]
MDYRIKIGQHLVMGFEGHSLTDEIRQAVKSHKIGNIILFERNVKDKHQLSELCQDIKSLIKSETGYEPFIFIDQEGGVVSRLQEDCTVIPSAMGISASGKKENAYHAGLVTGRELNAMGVNFNLAPVLDINSNPKNPVIGVRSYGDNPQFAADFGCEMARGLVDGGVLCCAKHFPGHGDTDVDSHLGLPKIDKSKEEMLKFELVPFIAASNMDIPAIMSSHILFPQIDKNGLPATMSYTIMTELLRNEIGFKGLILSDCMQMQAISDHFGTVKGMLEALKAGIDVIFASHSAQLNKEAAELFMKAINEGDINIAQFEESTERILKYKQKMSEFPKHSLEEVGSETHRILNEQLYRESVSVLGELPELGENPCFVSCKAFVTTVASNPEKGNNYFAKDMQGIFGGTNLLVSSDPSDDEIKLTVEKAKNHSCIVVGTYNAHIYTGQEKMLKALCDLKTPVIAVALRNPYDVLNLPENAAGIAVYAYNKQSVKAVAEVIAKKIKPTGKMPLGGNK